MKINRLSGSVQRQLRKIAEKDGNSRNLSSLDLKRASSSDLQNLAREIRKNGVDNNEKELLDTILQLADENNIKGDFSSVTEKDGHQIVPGKFKSFDFQSGKVNDVKFDIKVDDVAETESKFSSVKAIFQERDAYYYIGKAGTAVALISEFESSGTQDFLKKTEDKGVKIPQKDIAAIVKNQMALGRSSKEIMGAIQAYAIIQEALSFNKKMPNTKVLKQVQKHIMSGAIRINPNASKLPDGMSVYDKNTNTVEQKNFNINNPFSRALLFHELVHAAQDIKHKGDSNHTHGMGEMESYLAQGIYEFYSLDGNPTDKLTEARINYAKSYLLNGAEHPETRRLAKVFEDMLTSDEYQGKTYNDKWNKSSRSNGIN